MSSKLRIGILLDDYCVSAWSYQMFENICSSGFAEIALIVLNDNEKEQPNNTLAKKIVNNRGRFIYLAIRKILEFSYEKLVARHSYVADANKEVSCSELFANTPVMKVKTIGKKWSDYFHDDDVSEIREHNIDILVRCGFRILRGDILNAASGGVWSFHHGDNQKNRGGPAGYWESMEGWSETGSVLQILTEDLDNGHILARFYSCTDTLSVQDNVSGILWKSLSLMTRKMEEYHRFGKQSFLQQAQHSNRHPAFYSERLYVSPTNAELARLTFWKLIEKIKILYHNRFVTDQWILMFHISQEFSSSLWRYKKIIPPKDRFWADPHVVQKNSTYYIFFEEYLNSEEKGRISLITMDEDGSYSEPEVILDKSYHLSYPYVFEHDNEYYMIPETMANHTIELYKCVDFPYKWEFQMNLMENIQAVDATLYRKDGKWWMFANVLEHGGASTWDELYIFFSEELYSASWTPHVMNPVVSDCKSSRPAGRLFVQNGGLYRPSQNCSTRYGYGFNIGEIKTLNETEYEEEIVSRVQPNWEKQIKGTHTFNRVGSLHVVDALYRRRG